MIIDIHAHTSNHRMWGLHVESATIRDLEQWAERFGVTKIVLMATYFPYKSSGLSNHDLLDRIRGNDLFLMFGSLDVMNSLQRGLVELDGLARMGLIAGIKLYPGYQNFNPSDEKVFVIYELARKYHLPVMFHTGELHHCCPRGERHNGGGRCGEVCWIDNLGYLAEPQSIQRAAEVYPDVTFVFSHLGNPFFQQCRQVMRQCPNVYTDISGQFVSGTEEDTPEYREELGNELQRFMQLPGAADRIMFATDFPIQSYQDSVDLVGLMNLSEADHQKVMYQNAANLLGFG